MGYSEALEAAGAKVLAFKEFGSYQGDWAAIVEFNGEKGVATGSYGSCSGCDAFQAEFDFCNSEAFEKNGKYYYGSGEWDDDPENEISKEEYEQKIAEQKKKLADFGMNYLTAPLYTITDVEQRLSKLDSEEDWFSQEEKEMWGWCLQELTVTKPNQ